MPPLCPCATRMPATNSASTVPPHRPRHKEWISWSEAQATRWNATRFMEESPPEGRWERIMAQEQLLLISLFTTAPPDRCGVIRTLSFGRTLKKHGATGWMIDLTLPGLHKTSKFYGPSKVCVSPASAVAINALITMRQGDRFDFNETDAAGRGDGRIEYLFHGEHPTRCLDSSTFSRKVSQAFERFSPRHNRTPPRLLRSAFVMELRDDPSCPPEVKEAAAVAMRHALDTANSDVYDLATHQRLTEKAFVWTAQFAQRWEERHAPQAEAADPAPQPAQAAGSPPAPPAEEPPSQPDSLTTTEEVMYSDDAAEFDIPATPAPPPAASSPAATPSSVTQASPSPRKTPNSLRSILEGMYSPSQPTPIMQEEPEPEPEPTPAAAEAVTTEPVAAPAPTPMGRLPSARIAKQAKRQRTTEPPLAIAVPPPEQETFDWELITGATSVDGICFRVLWRGDEWRHLTDWWEPKEEIDSNDAFADSAYDQRRITVLPQGDASAVSGGTRPVKGTALELILGAVTADGKRECFEGNGTRHVLDLATCVLDDKPPIDWLLDPQDATLYLTDAVLGESWAADSGLAHARQAWGDGSEYPTMRDTMTVLRTGLSVIADALSGDGKQAAMQLCVFINNPMQDNREQAKGSASTLRGRFLFGGLLYDALSVIMGIEEPCTANMQRLARLFAQSDPAQSAWYAAQAAGML